LIPIYGKGEVFAMNGRVLGELITVLIIPSAKADGNRKLSTLNFEKFETPQKSFNLFKHFNVFKLFKVPVLSGICYKYYFG